MAEHLKNDLHRSMPCLLESITGVWKFDNWSEDLIHAYSTPGHLFHYMISGKYHLQANGREYEIKPDDIIYYHDVEEVTVECGEAPIKFYSLGFLAPDWPSLPLSMRVFHGGSKFKKFFATAYDSFQTSGKVVSQARLSASIFKLIELVELRRAKIQPLANIRHSLWWEIENTLIRTRNFHASIDEMLEIGLLSRSTLNRVCKAATGLSPRQRIIKLRMNHAEGLLKYSTLSINEISRHLGYSRINEFSREFHKTTDISPSQYRKNK